jgi:hypothetical protein
MQNTRWLRWWIAWTLRRGSASAQTLHAKMNCEIDGGLCSSILLAPFPPCLDQNSQINANPSSRIQSSLSGCRRRVILSVAKQQPNAEKPHEVQQDSETVTVSTKLSTATTNRDPDGCLLEVGVAADEVEWRIIENSVLSNRYEFVGKS